MKDNSETRGGNTGTQGNNQSETTQMKGSQFKKEEERPAGSGTGRPDQGKNQPGQWSGSGTQQSGGSGGQGSHAGSSGTGSGQISPQTHDTANAGRGQGGSGAGSSGRENQNS